MTKGKLFVISAPSGSGKTSLIKAILADPRCKNLEYVVSHTTRKPRPGEIDGRDYNFISQETFKEMAGGNGFLEWTQVFDQFYGTARAWITERLNKGIDILADVDVVGDKSFRNNYKNAILIFIVPPTIEILKERLRNRQTETVEATQKRLERAALEIENRSLFNYLLINDDFQTALNDLESIINCGKGQLMSEKESFWPDFFNPSPIKPTVKPS
jgi:guanylate kinase